jgi:hypothetical protein
MNARNGNRFASFLAMLLPLLFAVLMPHGSASAQDRPHFSQQQLEQTLAPIALYPDPLLSQILMASTYPLEVVEAARWSKDNANLRGEDAVRAAANEDWDPSVKSLLAFPQVLARMDENLQWLQTLGDAFLGQEPQVMETVQNLRRKARVAGNLQTDERQRIVETGPLLVVQPADPRIIYVPYYDPRVIYGPWGWPDYAPVYWRPFPGYYAWPGIANSFYWGPSIRISIGYFFGGFDWSRRHVRVVHAPYYYRAAPAPRVIVINRDRPPGAWHHDPAHRRGIAYRGAEVRQRFADAGSRPDRGHHPSGDAPRRQEQQAAQSYPTQGRRHDAVRPVAPVAVQSNEPRGQRPLQQVAQPQPAPGRQGSPGRDVQQSAVQPVKNIPAPAASQEAAATGTPSVADARAERRAQTRGVDRGERRDTAKDTAKDTVRETTRDTGRNTGRDAARDTGRNTGSDATEVRQPVRPVSVVSQAERSRNHPVLAHGDRAETAVRTRASASAASREPRLVQAPRQETQQGSGRRSEVQDKPEARPGFGRQRDASNGSGLSRGG